MEQNRNTAYELLAKEIYETLYQSEGMTNINIQHNVKVKGLSGIEHQIDVYWEFQLAGLRHRVAIECKNYSSKVTIGKIRDFHSVLSDIGNINGIYVSKEGFQKGAIKYAESYGIVLKEMRFPKQMDWEGRLKDTEFLIEALDSTNHKFNIIFDEDWLRETYGGKQNLEKDSKIIGGYDSVLIEDENGLKIKSIIDMINDLPVVTMKERENLKKVFTFENGFIRTNKGQKLKINGFEITYDIETLGSESFKIEGDAIAKAILKDVKSGDIKFFDHDGGVK